MTKLSTEGDAGPKKEVAPLTAKLVVVLIVAACLGPYVFGGVRTEQLIIYPLAVAALAFPTRRSERRSGFSPLSRWWAAYAALVMLTSVLNMVAPLPLISAGIFTGSLVAGLDNVLTPLAIIVIVKRLVAGGRSAVLVETAACTIIVGSVISAATAWAQAFTGATFSRWWSSGAATSTTTAELAASNGRYSGIFNQPAEAGLFFGLSLLAAVYTLPRWPALGAIGVVAALVGGFISVSKVLLFLAIPLALWQYLSMSRRRPLYLLGLFAFGAGVATLSPYIELPNWPGSAQLRRVLNGLTENPLTAATAGRFGDSATLSETIAPVLEFSPLFGFGAAGVALPYDNAWVEALVMAGILGAVTLTGVIYQIVKCAMLVSPSRQADFLRPLSLLAAAACLGLPALTANRASSVLWLLLGLLLAATHGSGRSSERNVYSE